MLCEGKCLLARIGECRNVAVLYTLFQFLELRQILMNFEQRLRVRKLNELGQARIKVIHVHIQNAARLA